MIVNLVSALIGAIAGGAITWYVTRRHAFLERCHTQIERACEELQSYRVVYAQYFVEYLSDNAKTAGRHWASVSGTTPDMNRLEIELRLDASRGRLRVHAAIVSHILRGGAGEKATEAIRRVLHESSHPVQTNPRIIDRMCDEAMNLLINALPR